MPIYPTSQPIMKAMFGLGHWELIIILVIILVVFGAGKLPGVGSALGEGIRNFKGGLKGEKKSDDPPKQIDAPKTEAAEPLEKKVEKESEKVER